ILGAGVAIEQFVIDLASYYRSLLLLKNGVTRESLLGYSPELFSAKAVETFDSIRLEQALDVLLACYRDIRYSVSPRFELETAVSKLSWLSQWITPVELKALLEQARGALHAAGAPADTAITSGGGGGAGRPLAEGGPRPQSPVHTDAAPRPPGVSGAAGGRSLSEDFRRMIEARASGDGGTDDDDVPMWAGIAHNKNGEANPLERVLRVISGTVVQ
ncbi:MAG: hypothetical protein LBD48_08530, partial [Treponema sp.]|nr:hypothetical protein [Treponema sp.]